MTTKEFMARIGHSSPRAALIYQHATEERDRAAAEFLDEEIAKVERPSGQRGSPTTPARAKARDERSMEQLGQGAPGAKDPS